MATSAQLKRLLTRPSDYARFQMTGRLPRGTRPTGALVDLLKSINPRDRIAMVGFKVDARTGYTGSRQFHNAEQALRWICPSDEVFDSFPAESWRIKNFKPRLSIDEVIDCCAKVPPDLARKYPALALQKRTPAPVAPTVAASEDVTETDELPPDELEPRARSPRP